MALSPRLVQRQTQTLTMTPHLQQAIKLLQLSNLELNDFIDRELERNPLLEPEDQDGGLGAEEATAEEAGAGGGEDALDDGPDQPDSVDQTASENLGADNDASFDADYGNMWETDDGGAPDAGTDSLYWQVNGGGGDGFRNAESAIETTEASRISLRDHLLRQINVDIDDQVDRLIALQLIEMLDDSGYLAGDLIEAAAGLGCDIERVESVLEMVQRFDPPGVFARNLSECLALQLRDRDRYDPAMKALVANLDLLAKRDFAALRNVCGVDAEDIADMVGEIKTLNPKPALAFDNDIAQPVVPDVIMQRRGDEWLVELNADTLPRVLINNRYYARIKKHVVSREEKSYIAERYQAANWLVKAMHQRAQTILKVATELVKQQEAFLNHGVQHLKPLVLRNIAEAVGVHESTVSRVTNNKYLATPRGIFEMKYFFTFGLGNTAGGGTPHSAEAIRFRIKSMIDKESLDEILSDDRIVVILRGTGVDIARRTVAKYRETMRIPSSVQRRREKTLHP